MKPSVRYNGHSVGKIGVPSVQVERVPVRVGHPLTNYQIVEATAAIKSDR